MSPRQEVSHWGSVARGDRDARERTQNFKDPRREWRRLFSELLGTFFLVLVAAGGGMMNTAFPGTIGRSAAAVASSHHSFAHASTLKPLLSAVLAVLLWPLLLLGIDLRIQ